MSLITFNYYCLNNDCNCKDMQHATKEREEENEEEFCIGCEQPLKCVGEKISGFLRTASMSPEQKKQVLLKRSSQHFNKEIKERKHEMEKQTFGKSDY